MTPFIGALLVTFSALFWGYDKSKREKEKLGILEGLISFVAYTEEQITNFRTPLMDIFEDFSNEELERCGFTDILRKNGAEKAVSSLEERLPKSAMKEALNFAKCLGGGYSEGQTSLCSLTHSRLEKIAGDLRESLPGKLKMYRLLPVLLAASVIILLI